MRDDHRLTFIGDHNICDFMDLLIDAVPPRDAFGALWPRLDAEDWAELDLWG